MLVLTAAPTAADWTGEVTLLATATIDGKPVQREVRPYTRCFGITEATSRPSRKLALAVREPGPFAVIIEPAQASVEAGKTIELTFKATRQWPDFKAAINLLPLASVGKAALDNG